MLQKLITLSTMGMYMNINLEGEKIIGVRSAEFTLVDYPTMDERGLPPKK